jgi:hypothetical protein
MDMLSGIEVVMNDGKLWIFWCGNSDAILVGLRALGYPVTLTPVS